MKVSNSTMWGTLLAILALITTVGYFLSQLPTPQSLPLEGSTEAQPATNTSNEKAAPLEVSVVKVETSQYSPVIQGFGEVKARYQLSLTSEVTGRVTTISNQLETGRLVKKGELLATIDQTKYRQAVSEARANLASAQLDVLEEERKGEQAQQEWQRSGLSGKPDSPLVLRQPQLEQVKAALENAEQELIEAEYNLKNTQVYAPFDSLVVSRDIQLGSYLQEGSQIARLYSTDVAEVYIPLSENQWSYLPTLGNQQLSTNTQEWSVTLTDSHNQNTWIGSVTRVEQHVDSASRQRSLIVSIKKPLDKTSPLYPGTFVTASIKGISINNLWKLPQSAISQQGYVWFVDADNKLAKELVIKQFEQGDNVFVTPLSDKSAQIVKRPLSSYSVGSYVEIVEETSL